MNEKMSNYMGHSELLADSLGPQSEVKDINETLEIC
jgi:hypothetical protein